MRQTRFKYSVTTLAGSTLKNISAVQKGHDVEPRYRIKHTSSKLIAGLLEICNLTERVIWQKRVREYRLPEPPVFIIGFWRSGTTLLHNLLCQDPRAAYTTTFQTVFPNLILTQSWWLKPILNNFLPLRRPYDNVSMDMDFPQEEDFGMMNMQPSTIYKFFLFPAEFDRIVEEELFTGNLPREALSKWKTAYLEMIAKASFNSGGTRYTGKNPCHLARIRLLLEMFPGAKFIFIHRHPHKVIESLYHFILSIFPGIRLQDVPGDFSREQVLSLYLKMMNAYFNDRDQIPPSNLIEIKMDDFLGDIKGGLRRIYEKFGLGNYETMIPRIDRFLTENPYPEHHVHSPDPGTIRLVDQQASEIMSRLGYG